MSVALQEATGPHVVFADGTQSVYLADMSGDGLSDLCAFATVKSVTDSSYEFSRETEKCVKLVR